MSLCTVRFGQFRFGLIIPILHACIEGILYYYNDTDYEPRSVLYSFEMGGLLGLFLEELVFDWAQDVKDTERKQKEEQEDAANKKKMYKKKDKYVVTVIEENGKKKRKPLFIFRRYPNAFKQVQPSNEDEKKKRKR
ncbi:uncharacterized protein LOC123293903 [Chrysoperla carnea]|uniref:uncharacterized protein LOC123293903 n=1 Tax=Chrysoperla carnea TaxID=189513 RepID=UPI001D06CF21|nr:uncharacterized protein LOC123293903 [Chrysoperla carnea]XP_044730833.1 uncharacterized protein LOC123293903 [Chrysoperla carnea]XP_044730834.1 uncharacterized protein LOC123293903 [Chrysoperla carnea]